MKTLSAKIICIILCFAVIISANINFANAQNSYFEMSESRFSNLSNFPKWTRVMNSFSQQKTIPDNKCGTILYHPCSIKEWKEMLSELQGKSLDEQLDTVNDWSNAHPYIIDQLNWGRNDYWETPYEFIEVNGDCEDYAISKYYSLRALGIPADRMRVIIVQDLNLGGIIHAILGVYDDNDELIILDNQIKQVRPALSIYHYRPIYGINERNWWTYKPRR